MPTLPPITPERTASGITVDPKTLERVVPPTKRPDGSVRKELKIRPGFTPQEDVNRFRGKRQAMADAMKLPPGHIVGWTPPSTESASKPKTTSIISNSNVPLTKAALKNAKRKAKRKEAAKGNPAGEVPDNWDDDGEEEEEEPSEGSGQAGPKRERGENGAEAEALTEKLDDLALS